MSKVVGGMLAILGVGGIALGLKPVQTALSLTLPSFLSNTVLMVIGLILLVIGAFLLKKASSSQTPEVPIYEGKNIVGYRKVN
jgi:hypothetical protein